MTDASQRVVWTANYMPFGEAEVDEDPDGDGVAVEMPLRFPGQYFDKETGLHYNWHRDYDPSTGRYIQSDPIGLGGGLNTYGYAYQNPITNYDPDGRFVWFLGAFSFLGGGAATTAAGGLGFWGTGALLGGALAITTIPGDTADTGLRDDSANDDVFDNDDIDEQCGPDDDDPCVELLAVLKIRAIQIFERSSKGLDVTFDILQYKQVRTEFCKLCPSMCGSAPSI